MIEAVTELPPIVVSDLFGIHPGTAHSWAKLAQASLAEYLAACEAAQ
ncbi:DNA-directed RNA polymerase specialized sigma24 family protein [Saccharothrix ecbatanensis]|uniref:DNA-directed RNA polymerase specialized sigma24 family protein n=1 Tax=Saccharothrix ecbatanensis TaxID=1105145 RepID=A0A7W9HG00_9PSEU|nr:DNA-directed RNA polymerase specialized sigma24 family protein [Saccharothrix ecbatanensis]